MDGGEEGRGTSDGLDWNKFRDITLFNIRRVVGLGWGVTALQLQSKAPPKETYAAEAEAKPRDLCATKCLCKTRACH